MYYFFTKIQSIGNVYRVRYLAEQAMISYWNKQNIENRKDKEVKCISVPRIDYDKLLDKVCFNKLADMAHTLLIIHGINNT